MKNRFSLRLGVVHKRRLHSRG